MCWKPKRGMSARAENAIVLLASGASYAQAAAAAGITQRHLERLTASEAGREFLLVQRAKYVAELRRARLFRQLDREMRVLCR